jgi:tetratricopeptide (TPR) repeat protein
MFLKKLFSLLKGTGLARGLEALEGGDLRGAIAIFLPHLEDEDSGVREKARLYCCETYLQLGDEIRNGDPAAALECYEKAGHLQPTFADLAHRAGEMHEQLGQFGPAQAAYERALGINPAFLAARLDSIALHFQRGESLQARESVDTLAQHAPEIYADAVQEISQSCDRGQYEVAAAQLMTLRDRSPSASDVDRQAARRALSQQQPEEAVRILKRGLGERRYPDLMQLLGLAYGQLGEHKKAEIAFRDALEVHPGYQKARINLALVLVEQERFEEAEAELRRVLEVAPDHPLALGALDEIHCALED